MNIIIIQPSTKISNTKLYLDDVDTLEVDDAIDEDSDQVSDKEGVDSTQVWNIIDTVVDQNSKVVTFRFFCDCDSSRRRLYIVFALASQILNISLSVLSIYQKF